MTSNTSFDFLRGNDGASTVFLCIAAAAVGGKLVQPSNTLRRMGLNLAAGAFVAYVVIAGIDTGASNSDQWAGIAFRGLLAAGLTLGISWIALPFFAFLYRFLIAAPRAKLRRWTWAMGSIIAARRARGEADRRAELDRAEWERRAPERERARQQAEEAARAIAESQRRREDARASALLSFTFYAAKLDDRFSRKDFDHYLATYMGDSHPPDVVERRGQELVAIFERHLADVQPAPQELTIERLTAWYEEMKGRIGDSTMDDRSKRTHLAVLYARFTELMSQAMENMKP